MDDFHFAIDRVIGGLEKKNKIISPLEKKVIAYHEAGHAVIGWFLEHTDPLVKVTIVPRGVAALGFAQYLPKENYIVTTQQMQDRMCMALGGRAAELAIYNHLSTGAQSDLDMVTKMAYAMVSVYGMSEKIGNVSFHGMGDEYGMQKPYSDETAKIIDEEARDIILLQMQRASTMLVEKADALESIAQELLLKEILYSDDLERLIGKSPYDKRMIYDDAEVEKKIEG
jgi:cell division protease FtsH